ncbi:dTDP-4-amino-4,6-dideoxygalactose transaminase [Porticoccus hydrocarbonoclasticus]|uniref:dTDP-4-amino-4,6-dideoxygalactose transaminase n=1 Tax=Porticoccus hydrocarbonoclasticus TaxID=1073414 RepID=UPI0030ED9388|tara:strand:- start:13694 stop:14830 length:1137 start_codon:yes stop_codon:yes gene_type:complete
MTMIPFNKPPYTGNEDQYVLDAMRSGKMSGDGPYSRKCHEWFESHLGCARALLTPSCTHALELAAILIDTQPGDEIIMPSYTFVSTANAFVLRGAKIVFVDIRADTLNLDETLIEQAITDKTKAIVPVHYAGIACEMDTIMAVAERHGLYVIEDAAQGMMSTYKGRPLGTIGHMGAYSFHDTKNYTSGGEGGLLIVNRSEFTARAEILREKGTNRSQFFRGMVDKYSWVDMGSSYLLSDMQAAYLWGQLEFAEEINDGRLSAWSQYWQALKPLHEKQVLMSPTVPEDCAHNAHMFYIRTAGLEERSELLEYLKQHGVAAVFHYVPLHSAKAGIRFGRFQGEDINTTRVSDSVIRLPLWYGMQGDEAAAVISGIRDFYC